MSQLIINRFFKPFLCKNFLRNTSIGHIRLLSTSNGLDTDSEVKTKFWYTFSTTAHPFLLVDHILNTTYGGKIKDKEVMWALDDAFRAVFSGKRNGVEFSIRSYSGDDYSPKHPVISYIPNCTKNWEVHLPTLPIGSNYENMAMSYLPKQDKDWVVGVKFSGSRVISFCRPFGSCQWVDAKVTSQSIHPFASIMFSKKDQRFYIPTPGGNYMCSFDPYSKEEEFEPNFIELEFEDLPKSAVDDLAFLSSCSKTDHLVESSTGQFFLVRWYGQDEKIKNDNKNGMKELRHKTKHFMVFRAAEPGEKHRKTMIYTEDIGDLCIFVRNSEAFCVPVSSSPGLKPNCIYFVGDTIGVYNLTTKFCTVFHN